MAREPSFLRRVGWRLEAVGYDALAGVMRLLPIDTVSGIGGWLLRTLGPLTPTDRVVRQNLAWAFPEWDRARTDQVVRGIWDNIGRSFFEFPIVDRILGDPTRVEWVGMENLTAAKAAGATVFISGHFANWELLPAMIIHAGLDPMMTYRSANNPHVDARMQKNRARYGWTRFAAKGEATRELMQALRNGDQVAFLIDQKFNEGVSVPFFGKPAPTTTGAARLAVQYDAPVVPISGQRLGGARFRVTAHPPISLPRTGDRNADTEAGTALLTRFIEDRIREKPEDWFWVHRRWPKRDYEAAEKA